MSGPVIKVRVIRQPVLKARMLSQWPARVAVGSVTTGEPGTSATVENVGTAGSAVLNFTIPRGNDGIVQSLVAGSNITINATDPAHPIINSTASGSGDVVGPSSAVDGTPTVFDGTSGKLLKNITFSAFKALLSLVKGDVGLGNVDNTSDSTKNAATATLTNKTLTSPVINGATGSAASSFTATTQAARDNSTKLATTAYVDVATRELLTANRTYYVRTDGNDSNNGLANSSGGAFLTPQAALNAAAKIDFNGFTVTIQIGDGTYTGYLSVPAMVGQANAGALVIQGNVSTPSNVVLTQAGLYQSTIAVPQRAAVTLTAFRVEATNNGYGFYNGGGTINYSNVDFGVCAVYHIFVEGGFTLQTAGNVTISGNAVAHWNATAGGLIKSQGRTITASTSIAFGVGFAAVTSAGVVASNGNTFSGTFTGPRYNAMANGVINTFGSGSSYFPGSTAGSTATGGQYL